MDSMKIFRSEAGRNRVISFYDKLLEKLPENSTCKKIPGSFGKTHTILVGDHVNPALVLLHGSGSNSAMWMDVVHSLYRQYYLVLIDIPGECGKSDPVRISYDENYSKWLKELVDFLCLKNYVLAGYSLGGWIAMDFAIRQPQRVDSLLLLAPGGLVPVKFKTIIWIVITSLFGKAGFKQLNKMLYNNHRPDKTTMDFAGLIQSHFISRTDVLPLFCKTELEKIQCPVYYLGGSSDCFYDSNQAVGILQKYGLNVRGKILKGQGHVIANISEQIKDALKHNSDEENKA